ncbi:DUF4232 domain-containing protein [Pseudonocardia spinosispora]|uniref:DUF4232 domain-containing protein n=1 Tax=Pseudonocardia spinosispora TaxID=103441 RepID=UPI000412C82D|nr:DUF4232 domain-containing protein [Pseudonocardia spinosispora]
MRILMGLTAATAAMALAGCGGPAPTEAPPSPSTQATSSSEAPSTTPKASGGATARCHTAQLSVDLGQPSELSPGQNMVPLAYTNTSDKPCQLHGVPGLDLQGPDDPNGPVYSLPRKDLGKTITLAPGARATARIVVLSYEEGSVGSSGSKKWTPTKLVTIPPGETTPLTAPWPATVSVLRQDAATHPGSWVESFTAR